MNVFAEPCWEKALTQQFETLIDGLRSIMPRLKVIVVDFPVIQSVVGQNDSVEMFLIHF